MCIHFKIHHPYSIKKYSIHQIDADHEYFDNVETKKAVNEFVDDCLIPLNKLISEKMGKEKLKIKLAISGVLIELLRDFRTDALESMKELTMNKNVNVAPRPYFNSCSEYFSLKEYEYQVEQHGLFMKALFKKAAAQELCAGHVHCSRHARLLLNYSDFKSSDHLRDLEELIEISMHGQRGGKDGPGYVPIWEKGYDKRLLQKLYGLEKMVNHINDPGIFRNWRMLQDVLFYGVHQGEESLAQIKNILSDFEILLIKKCLSKIKRPQKELPVLL